jgi:hypothetical protein
MTLQGDAANPATAARHAWLHDPADDELVALVLVDRNAHRAHYRACW